MTKSEFRWRIAIVVLLNVVWIAIAALLWPFMTESAVRSDHLRRESVPIQARITQVGPPAIYEFQLKERFFRGFTSSGRNRRQGESIGVFYWPSDPSVTADSKPGSGLDPRVPMGIWIAIILLFTVWIINRWIHQRHSRAALVSKS